MPRILRRPCIRVFVAALVLACGAQWFFMQSLAWATMLAGNVRHTTLIEAVKETFDGAHPCELCKKVDAGRQREKQHPTRSSETTIVLFHERPETPSEFAIESRSAVLQAKKPFAETRAERPPHLPPRVV